MIPDPKNPTPSPASIILDVLSQKPRLAVQDLYEYFIKKYKAGMTIQGFYKLIKQLVGQRVLVKEGHLISIDASWILNLTNFTENLQKTYFGQGASVINIILREGETKKFTFEKVIDLDNFWTHALVLITNYVHPQKDMNKEVSTYNDHCWFQIARTDQEKFLNENYEKKGMKQYFVCSSDSFLDTLTPQLVGVKGFKFKTIPKNIFPHNYYCMTLGDFIFETSLPKYIYELIEAIYNKTKNLSQFNIQDILFLINQPGKAYLTITRDKKKAAQFRKKILAYFK